MKKAFKILIILLVLIMSSVNIYAREWVLDEDEKWRCLDKNGNYEKNVIELSGKDRFYLNDEGYIEYNFYLQDYKNHNYYFGKMGAMLKDTKVQITTRTKSNKEIKYPKVIFLDSQGREYKEENNVTEDMILNNEKIKAGEIIDVWEDDVITMLHQYRIYKVGDTVYFGKTIIKYLDGFESEESLKWTVVSKDNGLYLVSQRTFDSLGYNYKYKTNEYDNSKLRMWLTNEFYNNSFSEVEKRIIQKVVSEKDLITILDENSYNNYIMNKNELPNRVHIALHIRLQ